jgi:hypothetical protein
LFINAAFSSFIAAADDSWTTPVMAFKMTGQIKSLIMRLIPRQGSQVKKSRLSKMNLIDNQLIISISVWKNLNLSDTFSSCYMKKKLNFLTAKWESTSDYWGFVTIKYVPDAVLLKGVS